MTDKAKYLPRWQAEYRADELMKAMGGFKAVRDCLARMPWSSFQEFHGAMIDVLSGDSEACSKAGKAAPRRWESQTALLSNTDNQM